MANKIILLTRTNNIDECKQPTDVITIFYTDLLCNKMEVHRLTKFGLFFFVFNDTATTEIYTLSLHDALPISLVGGGLGAILLVLGRRADDEIAEGGADDHDALGPLRRHRQDRGTDEPCGRLVEDDELTLARRDPKRG